MSRIPRGAWLAGGVAAAAALIAALAIGCGKSQEVVGGSATVAMPTPPDYLDPQLAYTTEAAEADWIAYTPLLTYRHKSGADGTELIPGLALRLPRISPEGRRYRIALRKGLVYSNGTPVQASDFEYAIERALRLDWPGKRFITANVAGAEAYDQGRAKQISGIAADDAHAKLSIKLIHPNGAFANVLALPATAPVPAGTPMKDLSRTPPPGVGPYRITDVVPGRRWTMVKNPRFASLEIPDIPAGSLERITVKVQHDARSAADKVLRDRADNFDPGTPLPPGTTARALTDAPKRFDMVPIPSTLYFFMDSAQPPFSSELARRAVVTALDRPALAKLGKGAVLPGCYLLPQGIVGHPSGSCPYGDADDVGDVKAARQLVRASGTAGAPVLVWVEDNTPQRAYARYYTKLLNRIGFSARLSVAATSQDFGTVGKQHTYPQTGFASWFNDFPNPADFYEVLDSHSIGPPGSPNAGRVQDLFIQQQLEKLRLIPAQDLDSAASGWQDLDEYAAKKAYLAVIGQQQVPKLMSDRIDFASAVIHPLFLSDWSSWSLH
ncbi:MAG: ABC transporter substrate-binding protein [Solirubrobacterales bacterium]